MTPTQRLKLAQIITEWRDAGADPLTVVDGIDAIYGALAQVRLSSNPRRLRYELRGRCPSCRAVWTITVDHGVALQVQSIECHCGVSTPWSQCLAV